MSLMDKIKSLFSGGSSGSEAHDHADHADHAGHDHAAHDHSNEPVATPTSEAAPSEEGESRLD
jgi:hypothetical protein